MNYEFVPGDTIEIAPGKVLHRIRATTHIKAHGVKPGDLGGYIESPENLDGDVWVSGNARVSDNARVSGDVWVSDNARVSGDARVCGDAMINENGLIFWASKVGSENGTLTVYNTKFNELEVTRGCFRGSVDEFLVASKAKHDDDTHHEYRLLIEVATSRITRARQLLKK